MVDVGPRACGALSRRQHPDGMIAVARTDPHALEGLRLADDALVLVAEGTEKPGNLGAMFRTADGAGVDAVIAVDPRTDLENPNVIRASQGSVFAVASAVATASDAVKFLSRGPITLVALTPEADADLWDLDLTGQLAVAIGSEDRGLSQPLREAARLARIPMHGIADSLNASVAVAVALYEALRQRR